VAGFIVPLLFARSTMSIFRTISFFLHDTVLGVPKCCLGSRSFLGGEITGVCGLQQPLAFFSFSFAIDRLAAFFLLIIAVVSACVALYAANYTEHLEGDPGGASSPAVQTFSSLRWSLSWLRQIRSRSSFSGTDGSELVHPRDVRVTGTLRPGRPGYSILS